jgi:hypothetical protein
MLATVFQGGSNVLTLTPPAGWVPLVARQPIGTRSFTVWGKVKASGDATMTWSTSESAPISLVVAHGPGPCRPVTEWVVGLVGVRSAANAIGGQSVQAGTDTTTVAPAITVPAETRVMTASLEATTAAESNIVSVSGATAWAYINPTNVTESTFLASVDKTTAGATGPVTTTYVNTQSANAGAVQIGIPAPAATAAAGTASGGFTFTAAAAGEISPLPGFDSIDQVLHTPGATWAHRGGSANWPEMTDYAYTRAAAHGYGVLEFSCARTSDGWWFGLHDANLDRTSGLSGSPSVSTMTRAAVEAYQITLNAGGNPQPYYGLIEFLQKWTQTHVVVIDPKNALSFSAELLDLIELHVPDAQDRVVMKFFGVGGGALTFADLCRARGFTTWGYFYQADYDSGALAANHARWDWLGMNLAATTAWTGGTYPAIGSYGQPVVAHIIQSQAEYDASIAKGATMVQVGNVAGVQRVGVESVIPDGDASASWIFLATAAGSRRAQGTAGAALAYDAAASGTTSRTGSAEAAWAVEGAAAGWRQSQGEGHASLTFELVASSSSTSEGSAAGALTLTLSAEGATVTAGAAAGAFVIAAAADGSAPDGQRVGVASGSWTFDVHASSTAVAIPDRPQLVGSMPRHTLAGFAPDRTLRGARG